MAEITLRIIDGADRGRTFANLQTPVTIGREDGNTIQLNDERVSRFHVKIQEDQDKIVLTDLDSTNGSKVNGEDIQLRILRFGDIISVGRSVLAYGSREQVAQRLAELRGEPSLTGNLTDEAAAVAAMHSLDFELFGGETADDFHPLLSLEPPELPARLSPGQAAQLSELLEYLHLRFRYLMGTMKMDEDTDRVSLDQRQWQNLIDLQALLANYLRAIGQGGEAE